MMFEELKKWLLTCPHITSYLYFNVVPDNFGTVAMTSEIGNSNVEEYIDGSEKREIIFNVCIIRDYDSGTSDVNMDAIEMSENITKWIEEQNKSRNLPNIDGVESVKADYSTPEILIDENETKCQYTMRYVLNYTR